FELSPMCHALGAEVLGVECATPPDAATADALMHAVSEHGVLLFRDQDITPDQHIAFTAALGPLMNHPLDTLVHPDYGAILLISNIPVDGAPSKTRNTGRLWHSDTSFAPEPAMGSLLHCKETPPVGGDTMFASMYAAYDALSDPFKEMLATLNAVHDYSAVVDLNQRDPEERAHLQARNPAVVHPVVRTHPVTGRKALYVGEAIVRTFEGMSEDESRPLLDFLFRHADRPEFAYRHQWRVNDIVFWDNRCVIHRAPLDYDMSDPANRRLMYRTTLAGDRPY
ncbi:MAG: TauD/TfdA dioxygenase family protein, partial [Alphaproteobacteria bacterium]